MEDIKCGNCNFWKEGECRKYVPAVIATTKIDPHMGPMQEEVTVFPMVAEDCWCGEWERKYEQFEKEIHKR